MKHFLEQSHHATEKKLFKQINALYKVSIVLGMGVCVMQIEGHNLMKLPLVVGRQE